MSSRKLSTSAVDAGQSLGAWLATRLALPAASAAALVAGGSVYVDGRRERDPARLLVAGLRLIVHEAPAPTSAAASTFRIVYQRHDVIVVDKPAGLASQATRAAAGGLDELVAAQFAGATLVHRIDRDTSGLVLLARAAAVARLTADLSAGRVVREYLAIVAGTPRADSFTLDAPIGPDPLDRRRQKAGTPGGKPARTHIMMVRAAAGRALLSCRLDTGRTHQIRVHLAHAGLPILGDPVYAPPAVHAAAPRLALHATRLSWPGGAADSPLPDELAALL